MICFPAPATSVIGAENKAVERVERDRTVAGLRLGAIFFCVIKKNGTKLHIVDALPPLLNGPCPFNPSAHASVHHYVP
ncbi:hypothetical protein NBRC103581_01066 [Gluconobacter wancherniae NBRC 103581]|nr:hypothetical protein NBRC103581_01066 [Gluconobacter wancherniae NBRC 103581]